MALAVASEREGRVYARVAGSSSVLLVPGETLGRIPVASRAYRDRNLRTLPPGARITGLAFLRLSDNHVVFSKQLDPSGASTWEESLESESAEVRRSVLAMISELRQLRAQTFVQDEFTNLVPTAGGNSPWTYQLDTTIALSGGDTTQTTTSSIFISERLGGTTMLAGSPEFGSVFEVTQPFLDACFALTFAGRDPGPIVPDSGEAAPATGATPQQSQDQQPTP